MTVVAAANAVHFTPTDLVAEVEAWGIAGGNNKFKGQN